MKSFGGCDCGSKVIDDGVEAVLSRKEVDWRVLSADFDEALGLTICKVALFTQSAKQRSTPWIGQVSSLPVCSECRVKSGVDGKRRERDQEHQSSYDMTCDGKMT